MYGGLDLSAKVSNKTGLCILNDQIELYTVYENDVILELLSSQEVIAIDAPLTEKDVAFRKAERELMKEYGPIFPLNMTGMRKLSKRGLDIKDKLKGEVIETFPRAVEKHLQIDMDRSDIEFGNQHEYDAYLCALAAKKYLEGSYKSYGNDEVIIVPG